MTEARRRAQASQIVVVNHHLYFADLALRARVAANQVTLVPTHDVVVFDEAHELFETAGQHFGYQVSLSRVLELTRETSRALDDDPSLSRRLAPVLGEIDRVVMRFFDALPHSANRAAIPDDVPAFGEPYNTVLAALARLEAELGGSEHNEIPGLLRRLTMLTEDLRFIVDRAPLVHGHEDVEAWDDPPRTSRYVRLLEGVGRARALIARPVDVAPLLRAALAPMPSIFISATLSTRRSFAYSRARLGTEDHVPELCVDSPFNYATQARIYAPADLPEPDAQDFPARAVERARDLVLASRGGAFILCTSHRMLPLMRAGLLGSGLRLFVQGDAPKSALLSDFAEDGNAVLIATQSFWQGVDVPGAALRLVVIDKLPFASPGDPLMAARLDAIRARGQDPFATYQLPQATLLLRQGFGRLIRHKHDKGLVAILDKRLRTKGYGRGILASLPRCPVLTEKTEAAEWLYGLTGPAVAAASP